MSNQQWETNKENVLPVKEGRSVTTLNRALKTETPQKDPLIKSKIQDFEDSIKEYVGSDPIKPWLEYFYWVKENCPSDEHAMLKIAKRCMKEYKDSPHYHQDIRYIKIWFTYIGKQEYKTAKDLILYMKSNHIGTKLSFFYRAEACFFEQNGEYECTEKEYQCGILSCKEPNTELKTNQRQFHHRVKKECKRICLEQAKNGEPVDPLLSQVELNGISMTVLRRLDEIKRTKSGSTSTNRNFGVLQEVRKINGQIDYVPPQAVSTKPATIPSGLGFNIYTDAPEEEKTDSLAPLQKLSYEEDQNRENERIPEKWSNVRIAQKPGSIKKAVPAFSVYVDPPTAPQVRESITTISKENTEKKESKASFAFNSELFLSADGLSGNTLSFEEYRAQFYKILPRNEIISDSFQTPAKYSENNKPFESKQNFFSTGFNRPDFENFDQNLKEKDVSNSKSLFDDDMTVNTKGAIKDIDDLFSTSQADHKNDLPTFDYLSTVKKSQKRPSQIYEDTPQNQPSWKSQRKDYENDKENMPMLFIQSSTKHNGENQDSTDEENGGKRFSESNHNILRDIDANSEHSLTIEETECLAKHLSVLSQSRKTSISGTNRISDVDENNQFLTGRRDTQDFSLLQGVQELMNLPN